MIPDSASGVSMQRSGPNSFCRSSVARNTPPNRPTSSPSTTTRGSRRISTLNASLMAWTRFISGMRGVSWACGLPYSVPAGKSRRRNFAAPALGGRHARGAQLVADMADGLDHRAAGAQLGAQAADVDVDGPRAARVTISPHPGQELLAAEHAARAFGQELEQLELLAGQLQRAAAIGRFDRHRVDHQIPDLDAAGGAERRHPPIELPDARIELGRH